MPSYKRVHDLIRLTKLRYAELNIIIVAGVEFSLGELIDSEGYILYMGKRTAPDDEDDASIFDGGY